MNSAKPIGRPAPEAIEEFTLRMPEKAMKLLRRIAKYNGTSCDALARQYIGAGLRDAERQYFADQVLKVTQDSLREYMDEASVEAVLRQIRAGFDPDAAVRPRGYPSPTD